MCGFRDSLDDDASYPTNDPPEQEKVWDAFVNKKRGKKKMGGLDLSFWKLTENDIGKVHIYLIAAYSDPAVFVT